MRTQLFADPKLAPPDEVARELSACLDADEILEIWDLWKLGEHMPEWLLLSDAPLSFNAPVFSEASTPGLFNVFIDMVFIILTDNTPCESHVNTYRNVAHPNQDECTVQARWKHLVRLGAERARLKAASMRSDGSRQGASRPAALAAAAAGKPLRHHARSKRQVQELWRAELQTAGTYSKKQLQSLGAKSQLAARERAQRNAVHEQRAEAEVQRAWMSRASGPSRARRANVTLNEAISACAAVPDVGSKGSSKGFTTVAIKQRRKEVRAREQLAAAEATAAKRVRTAEAAERAAAAEEARKQAAAQQKVASAAASDARIAAMWRSGEGRERLHRAAAPSASVMQGASSDASDAESDVESDPEAEVSEAEVSGTGSGSETEDEEEDEYMDGKSSEGEGEDDGDESLSLDDAIAASDAANRAEQAAADAAFAAAESAASQAAKKAAFEAELAARRAAKRNGQTFSKETGQVFCMPGQMPTEEAEGAGGQPPKRARRA